jgi:DNA end-binding protein Ku
LFGERLLLTRSITGGENEMATAPRPVWRGHLRLALVSCPIALHTVHRASGELHFHYINPETGNRMRMVTQDAETGEELKRGDLARGYEFEKDRYVLLDPEDFEKARVESSSVIKVDKFVDAADIPPIYFDASYYLAPDGEAGQDVYVVLREAIRETGKAALSRVVISRRERAVVILPMDGGLVLHTLHDRREIYDSKALFGPVSGETPDPEMVKLAEQLIGRQEAAFEPADIEDRYEARLREVIAAKLKGEGIQPEPPPSEKRGEVIDLMAALKASLGKGQEAARKAPVENRKAPAKTAAAGHRASRKRA